MAFKRQFPIMAKGRKAAYIHSFVFVYPDPAAGAEQLPVFGAEVTRQLRREEAQNKLALLTSLKNDVEENLLYVEELSNTLVFNSSLQFLVKYPTVSSARDAMEQMSAVAARRDFLLDYFVYVRSSGEIVTSTVRMDADRFLILSMSLAAFLPSSCRRRHLRNIISRIIFLFTGCTSMGPTPRCVCFPMCSPSPSAAAPRRRASLSCCWTATNFCPGAVAAGDRRRGGLCTGRKRLCRVPDTGCPRAARYRTAKRGTACDGG